jgi:hypothetical protein
LYQPEWEVFVRLFRAVFIAALLLPLLALPAVPASGQTPTSFLETFDGNPSTPAPFASPRWDVLVHSRDFPRSDAIQPADAHHGPDCSPPLATHGITRAPDAVFLCRDHLMTAIDEGGYGAAVLTPDHMVDFSAGEATIRFEMSTLVTSGRDWVDIWISPFDGALLMPLEDGTPSGYGEPSRGIQVRQMLAEGETGVAWIARINRTDGPSLGWFTPGWDEDRHTGTDSFTPPSAATRTTFEIRLSRTRLAVCAPAHGFCWTDNTWSSPLPWTRGVVQIGQHSYTPDKDCNFTPQIAPCRGNTWHWDAVSISPAAPFAMVKTTYSQAGVVTSATQAATLARPAPASAVLRFHAEGTGLQVSADGGPWVSATAPKPMGGSLTHWQVAIPAGTTRVNVRGSNYWAGSWVARNLTVWAPADGAAPSPPTATPAVPTATATATATAAPPTATAAPPTATSAPATATPPPTATPAPPTATATAQPSATPVPAPWCEVRVRGQDGTERWKRIDTEPAYAWLCSP